MRLKDIIVIIGAMLEVADEELEPVSLCPCPSPANANANANDPTAVAVADPVDVAAANCAAAVCMVQGMFNENA